MLKQLKFVQGAVGKDKDNPALKHLKIENNHIRSFNGSLALSAPINIDLNCTPQAKPFINAIQKCDQDDIKLKMTPKGRLSIKSGSFKAFIECLDDQETPHVKPEGQFYTVNGEKLMGAFKRLLPFVGSDKQNAWAQGILLKGRSAYATNNTVAVEHWIGDYFPITWNIPGKA